MAATLSTLIPTTFPAPPPTTLIDTTEGERLNNEIDAILNEIENDSKPGSPQPMHAHVLKLGLSLLKKEGPVMTDQAWANAIEYSRDAIISPKDDKSRATAAWTSFCSDVSKELQSRFGPSTIQAAQDGCKAIADIRFNGNAMLIPHVDKKRSYLQHWRDQLIGDAFPADNIFSTVAYECGSIPCAVLMLAWASPEQSAKLAAISHIAICDDYGEFTSGDRDARIRCNAIAIGAAYELGGWAANAIIDGSLLQCQGNGAEASVESAMSWRAVSGCTSPYTGYLYGVGSVEDGIVAPQVLTGTHDLFDWRADTAAGNFENGVSVGAGLGLEDPFHAYLEGILQKTVSHPTPAIHAIAGMTIGQFMAARYGTYDYRGKECPACDHCTDLLRRGTEAAGFRWEPEQPPRSFAEGNPVRRMVQDLVNGRDDHNLVQRGLSWFQHLVSTGEIRLFDILTDAAEPVDVGNPNWV